MFYRICVRDTRKAFSASSESSSGNYCAFIFVKKSFTELFGRKSEFTDVRPNVERALRLKGLNSDRVKSFVKEAAAAIILGDHFFNVRVSVLKGFEEATKEAVAEAKAKEAEGGAK